MYQCSPSRIVSFFDEVNVKSMEKLCSDLCKVAVGSSGEWISLFLCSQGGRVDPAFATYEFIHHILQPKLQTVALGNLASMTPLLYLMGDHRVITPETTLWFHHLARIFDDKVRINTPKADQMGRELLIDEEKYFRIIEERTGGKTNKKQAKSLFRNERTLNAKDSVKFGFAHEIVSVEKPS
jgi:ATP-dependent protease ClpP protease subunit